MKKLLWLTLLLAFFPKAHAQTCMTLSSGASETTIKSALSSCAGTGKTVAFSAGTYGPITSTVSIPCGVSLSGPVVAYSQTPNQTALVNGSSSNGSIWGFQTTAGCSQSQTLQYLEWNGQQPANSGGFLDIVPGTVNLTVTHNYLHGVSATAPCCSGQNQASNLITFTGRNANVVNNVLISWNVFGTASLSDCSAIMKDSSSSEINNGGFCSGIGIGNNVTNVTIENNVFRFLEQGMKFYEGDGEANPLTVLYNDYNNIHRINFETQSNSGTADPANMTIRYNSVENNYQGTPGSWGFSSANGCAKLGSTGCITNTDDNVIIGYPQASNYLAGGVEEWGTNGTTASYNLIQGWWANSIVIATNGQFTDNYNTMQNNFNPAGYSTCSETPNGCGSPSNGSFFNNEDGPSYTVSATGNTFASTSSALTSVAATISPASGSFNGSQVVTIGNPGGNRDLNTTDWCTTDGSTPKPGSGTSVAYYNGGTLTVTATTTVRCLGMWGAPNQPYAYPAGYGYVASAVVSNTYTSGGGNPTITGGYLGDPGNVNTVPVNAGPIQFTAYATYSDGNTRTLPDTYGNTAVWSSSNSSILSVGSTGVVSCIASGSANVQVNVNSSGGLRLHVWGMSCTLPADPTVTGGYLGDPGSVNTLAVGASAIQFTAYGTYSDGNTRTLPDAYGNTAVWSSSNSSILNVGSSGLVSCLASGTANVQVNVNSSSGFRLHVWGMTCTH